MSEIDRINQVLKFSEEGKTTEFLSGFEHGYGIAELYRKKRKKVDLKSDDFAIIYEIPSFLKTLDKSSTRVPGQAIGKFVGILHFHPSVILDPPYIDAITGIISSLHNHPWFSFYIASTTRNWGATIQELFPTLQGRQKDLFMKYRTQLTLR